MNNPFNQSSHDLGTPHNPTTQGSDRESVDKTFSMSNMSTGYQCAACGNPPQFKLIAKNKALDTEELRKNGYMCSDCISAMSKEDYGIRQL